MRSIYDSIEKRAVIYKMQVHLQQGYLSLLQDTEQNKKRLDIVKGRQSDFSGNKYFDNLAIETWNLEKLIRRVQEF
ncbi:MAG: hypothetical protein WCC17_16295 [Candidatus Nitrosopolaris sp.]